MVARVGGLRTEVVGEAVGAVLSLGSELSPHLSSSQATADPEGSRLTPHPWRMRGWQPLSGRASLFVSTLFLCHALGPRAWAAHWKQLGAAGGWVPLALWLFLAQLCF